MAKIAGEFTIDNSELIELRKDIKKYGDTEVLKVLSKFHREIAKGTIGGFTHLYGGQEACGRCLRKFKRH